MKSPGEHINALMDMMPPGTLACLTLLVQPQNVLEEEFKQQGKKSLGDNLDSEMARSRWERHWSGSNKNINSTGVR